METIGEKILYQRKLKNISQEALAFEMNVSRQTISKWESNVTQPTLDNIYLLCKVFSVSVTYFIDTEKGKDEIAVTLCEEDDKQSDKKLRWYKIGITLVSIILIISIVVTVLLAIIVFTSNVGDSSLNSHDISKNKFYVSIVFTIAFFICEVLLIGKYLRKRRQCKVKVTKCKEKVVDKKH